MSASLSWHRPCVEGAGTDSGRGGLQWGTDVLERPEDAPSLPWACCGLLHRLPELGHRNHLWVCVS